MPLSNDERGWVMTALSGVACVLGAAVICVDIVVRLFPGQKTFRIQDSNAFLSASLSLSFGVMMFSSLYSMLPSAKQTLQDGGLSSKAASWTLVACFLGGVAGIQVLSKIMHSFMPSHIVDCEHTHREDEEHAGHKEHHRRSQSGDPVQKRRSPFPDQMDRSGSDRPTRQRQRHSDSPAPPSVANSRLPEEPSEVLRDQALRERPSFPRRLTTGIQKLASGIDPDECECDAPCYGFTDPCGNDCFKSINARGGYKASSGVRPTMKKMATAQPALATTETTPLLDDVVASSAPPSSHQPHSETHHHTHLNVSHEYEQSDESSTTLEDRNSLRPDHHHHVPTNAFLSIGLQTSVAIALHKLPEGFITYATNHANPELGVAVFLALFIHNITEGFAMALPLYLALNNRLKAMSISFVLGGLSQPLGAAIAAAWFKIAGKGDWAPSESVYGAMFAVTAGILASVALSLFSEALDLTHSRQLCMIGAFSGMAILGMSSALTA